MAEVQYPFEARVRGADGREYRARILGRSAAGHWEGWIEFQPVEGGPALSTDRETTQPNQKDLSYWASGLTETYLEGALARALATAAGGRRHATGASDARGGASDIDGRKDERSTPSGGRPVLDPFAAYAGGVGELRSRLQPLSAAELRTIARAYGLAPDPERLELLGRGELTTLIVDGVALRSR